MTTVEMPNNAVSTVFFATFRLPCAMDVSRPSTIFYTWIPTQPGESGPKQVIAQLNVTLAAPGDPLASLAIPNPFSVTIPPFVHADAPLYLPFKRSLIDTTFLGGQLAPNSLLSFRLQRFADSNADTWENDVEDAPTLWFEFALRCQLLCCP